MFKRKTLDKRLAKENTKKKEKQFGRYTNMNSICHWSHSHTQYLDDLFLKIKLRDCLVDI